MSTLLFLVAIPLLAAINLWTYLQFRDDKRRARQGTRRIAEADLLALAALGGSPAALLARRRLRHKTRKQPFSFYLLLIVALQAGGLIGLAASYA